MPFIPETKLTAAQRKTAAKRWRKLEGYEYQFNPAGKVLARRASIKWLPGSSRPKNVKPAPESKPAATGKKAAKKAKPEPVAATPAEESKAPDGSLIVTSATTGQPGVALSSLEPAASGARFQFIPLELLDESATNPRQSHDQAKHEELVASMREHGFVEAGALLVRMKPGPGLVAFPCDPAEPEGAWCLTHPATNARQEKLGTFTEAEAERLAATKYAHRYEIVWGSRRSRAARAVGLAEAPAVVRELTDAETLELQWVENGQRADLNPIEEAEHIARLLALRDPATGRPIHTKETLAKRGGKSVQHVKNALSLCVLGPVEREAVVAGTLGLAVAYEIAGIPDGEVRARAAAEIINPTQGEAPMRKAAALDYIKRTCTRSLRTEAKFDPADADLVPVVNVIDTEAPDGVRRVSGGSCLDCPLNSANVGERTNGARRLGVCGNVACFDAKQAAGFERWRAQNHKPEAGREVLPVERNAEVFDAEGEIDWRSGLVEVSAAPDAGLLKADTTETRTWRELTKGKVAKVLVARHPKTGKPVEVLDVESAKLAAEENGNLIFKTSKSAVVASRNAPGQKGEEKHKAATLEARRQKEIATRTEARLLAGVADKATALAVLAPDGARILADWICGVADSKAVGKVERRRGLESGTLGDWLHEAGRSIGEHLGLCFELVLADYYEASCDDGGNEVLEAFSVSLEETAAAVAREVDAELAPDTLTPDAARAHALAQGWPVGEAWFSRRFTAEVKTGFVWNASGVCERPDVLEVTLPGKEAPTVRLKVAGEDAGDCGEAWFCGHDIAGKQFGNAAPVQKTEADVWPSRWQALAAAADRVAAYLDAETSVSGKQRKAMRAVAGALKQRAIAERDAALEAEEKHNAGVGEPMPAPAADGSAPEPTHLAYITMHALRRGSAEPVVVVFTQDDWLDALRSPSVMWLLPIGGVDSYEAATAAAREALRDGVGTVTQAGDREGFRFRCDDNGVPAPYLDPAPTAEAPPAGEPEATATSEEVAN